jgi:FKBP-type peptidyl-prolyl cis-trans isomerase SlyD
LQESGFDKLEAGQMTKVQAGPQTFVVTVKDVGDEAVTLDANSPLAGQAIDFQVTVKQVTPADHVERLTLGGGAHFCQGDDC